MRLTPLAKAFVTLVILSVVGFITWHHQHQRHDPEAALSAHDHDHEHERTPRARGARAGPIVVGLSEFAGAYPGIVANDGMEPGPRSRFTARGLHVSFKQIRDPGERLAAFAHGELDVLLL